MKISKEDISLKAYELWNARGCPPGSAEEDWYAAEALLQAATAKTADFRHQARKSPVQVRYGLREFR